MVYGCFVLSGWVTGVTGYCYGLLGRIMDGLIGYDGYIFSGISSVYLLDFIMFSHLAFGEGVC